MEKLTIVEIELLVSILEGVFAKGFGCHSHELREVSSILHVAAGLCEKAADIHAGLQVPWASMCYVSKLPSKSSEIFVSQELLEKVLAVLHVDIIKQDSPRRGCALPNFSPARDEIEALIV